MDNICSAHGLKLLDLCKSTSLRIANGRLGNDCPVGSFTYSSRNGCSVIDYLILSQPDFSCINDFHVCSFCEWSDHAPLTFSVLCHSDPVLTDMSQCTTKIKWDDSLRDEFRRSLISRRTDLNSIVNHIDISDRNSINTCVENFSGVLNEVANPLFCKEVRTTRSKSSTLSENKILRKQNGLTMNVGRPNNYI